MAALDIQTVEISQMQRVTFVFEPPTIAYTTISVVVTDADAVIVLDEPLVDIVERDLEASTVMIGRTTTPLPLGVTYNIQIETESETGASYELEMTLTRSHEKTIQQAIYDAISESSIVDVYGRTVTMLHDGLLIAEDVTDGETLSVSMPFIAVGRPVIVQTEPIGLTAITYMHEVEIKIADTQDDAQPNNVMPLHGIARIVVQRLIDSSDLGLNRLGFMQGCMDFKLENPQDIDDDDPLNTLLLTVEISQTQKL